MSSKYLESHEAEIKRTNATDLASNVIDILLEFNEKQHLSSVDRSLIHRMSGTSLHRLCCIIIFFISFNQQINQCNTLGLIT